MPQAPVPTSRVEYEPSRYDVVRGDNLGQTLVLNWTNGFLGERAASLHQFAHQAVNGARTKAWPSDSSPE